MATKAIDFPHPVLNDYTKDFIDSSFSMNITCDREDAQYIYLKVETILQCTGLLQMVHDGDAKIFVRVTCYRTCLRTVYEVNADNITEIRIAKREVCDEISIQGYIVATSDYNIYSLAEFNQNYFANTNFKLKKGNIIASEPGYTIKLDTILEKNTSGVVSITYDANATLARVNFANIENTDTLSPGYITIVLPGDEFEKYRELKNKKYLKTGVVRFMQAAIVFPAIVEAIGKLRFEEAVEDEDDEQDIHYKGTIWADSIYNALKLKGIEDIVNSNRSDYELANMILGNIVGGAISNILYKAKQWSTASLEDDVL